jgi:outer membrane protein assembly factor BamB
MKSPTCAAAWMLPLAFAGTLLTAAAMAADWPQWHGPGRDCHAPETALPATLPRDLKPAWKINVGGGHSSPIVAGNTLVYLDEDGTREVAHALDAATGKERWRADYAAMFRDEWGAGPRATPFIEGPRLYVQSCDGEFRCLSLADGKTLWRVNYEQDFGVKFLGAKANEGTATRRGNNGSGVIDGHRLILPVGGRNGASLACLHKETGKVVWKSGNDEAAYSSLVVGTLAGVRQVVAFTADALLGADLETGRVLWRTPLKTNAKRHAATPVLAGNRVIVNSHTFGLRCFEITAADGGLQAREAWANPALTINLATLVSVGPCLYGQGAKSDFICVDTATGQLRWSQAGFGLGRKDYASTIAAGDRLLVLTEDGTLVLLAANPARYTELGRLQACGSTWSFPALAGGKLYVRDARQLLCLDLAQP